MTSFKKFVLASQLRKPEMAIKPVTLFSNDGKAISEREIFKLKNGSLFDIAEDFCARACAAKKSIHDSFDGH